jgi:hypothetical protein
MLLEISPSGARVRHPHALPKSRRICPARQLLSGAKELWAHASACGEGHAAHYHVALHHAKIPSVPSLSADTQDQEERAACSCGVVMPPHEQVIRVWGLRPKSWTVPLGDELPGTLSARVRRPLTPPLARARRRYPPRLGRAAGRRAARRPPRGIRRLSRAVAVRVHAGERAVGGATDATRRRTRPPAPHAPPLRGS